MTTGQRIKAARKKAGMTQKELGEKLGLSFQSIAQWENDLRNPKYDTLRRIAAALGVEWTELISPEEGAQEIVEHIRNKLYNLSSDIKPDLPGGFKKMLIEDSNKIPSQMNTVVQHMGAENFIKSYATLDETLSDLLSDLGTPEDRLWYAFSVLNSEGQQKAVERVEELTEIPRYRRQDAPETAPQSALDLTEGKDTTPPPEGAEGAQEGE